MSVDSPQRLRCGLQTDSQVRRKLVREHDSYLLLAAGLPRRGWWPSDVIFDQAGNLYGTTSSSCLPYHGNNTCWGAVFKLSPNADGSWSESVLHYFCWGSTCKDGALPVDLIMDQAGNLYGTDSMEDLQE